MKKIIELDTLRVEIRGAKYSEVKELIRNSKLFVVKAKEIGRQMSEVQNEEGEEKKVEEYGWEDIVIEFLLENLDEFIGAIAQFTNMTKEQLENTEVPELILIIDAILKINKINLKKTYDFFYKLWKDQEKIKKPLIEFIQPV